MIQDGYSICFNKWVLDTRIKNELPVLLIISSLCAKTGECFASNTYFASLFDCTEVSVSQKINKLIKCGYLSVEYEKRGAEIKKRVLRLKTFLTDDLNIFYPTIKNIFKDNNISINSKKDNKKEIYKESFEEWWSFFPKLRAGSKSEAYKKYVQVITKEHISPQDLLQRVKIYAASEEVKRGYASGAVRYFNDCKYNNIYGGAVQNTNSIPADIDLYDGKYFDFNLNRVVATKEDNPDWSKYNRATGEFDL